jgi:hypothetical protein
MTITERLEQLEIELNEVRRSYAQFNKAWARMPAGELQTVVAKKRAIENEICRLRGLRASGVEEV